MIKESSYLSLPDAFYRKDQPDNIQNPEVLIFNDKLSFELGLENLKKTPEKFLKGYSSLALAYAGHQFGHFVPQLGDGRAHLMGEVEAKDGTIVDIQLKGSGATPFSRGGDGKSPLGPALREFLISEAIHHLGIPTTRSLAVLRTDENVIRNDVHPGGIVVRAAKSHIRVGSFEYFTARGDRDNLKILFNYTKNRLYPRAETPLELFQSVMEAQAQLLAKWMSMGFIHGVMNTDNCNLSGETIDYGPCAFMDQFKFNEVYSSIDRYGRYAYSNQPEIAKWNMSVLGGCIAFLEDDDKGFQGALDDWDKTFEKYYLAEFSRKFGLETPAPKSFIDKWLQFLEQESLDFTNSHRILSEYLFEEPRHDELKSFKSEWMDLLLRESRSLDVVAFEMNTTNPYYIPRNHWVEKALKQAEAGDISLYLKILEAVRNPFQKSEELDFLHLPPSGEERIQATFCGT